ncbi:MAG: type I secretion C-terminal target domain-containing protein, partial [Alphaproteobacteria bacterium]|nr:type I secretion C-terminal target domain-containing protein [Alphaproteobacteria bacterium]
IEAAEADESGLFVGADIVFGDEIPIGDVLIGGDGRETYRVTSESEGATVTILDFHAGDGGDRLDISELLATGSGSLDVAYDSRSESTTVTVSGVGTEDTVIVVYGADLTSDFDAYVVTDTIV